MTFAILVHCSLDCSLYISQGPDEKNEFNNQEFLC